MFTAGFHVYGSISPLAFTCSPLFLEMDGELSINRMAGSFTLVVMLPVPLLAGYFLVRFINAYSRRRYQPSTIGPPKRRVSLYLQPSPMTSYSGIMRPGRRL